MTPPNSERIRPDGWDLDGTMSKTYGPWVTVMVVQPSSGLPVMTLHVDSSSPLGALAIELGTIATIRRAEEIGQIMAAALDSIEQLPKMDVQKESK